VSVQVSGLTGTGLVVALNGGDNMTINGNGAATFGDTLASGAKYAVSVITQPAGEYCGVASGSGTIAAASVSVAVSCNPADFTVSVTLSGLAASNVVLQLNGGSQIAFSQNGTNTFSTKLASGEPYVVTVASQPTPPPIQTCTVANGSGTASGNVALTASCVTTYSVSASVTGLAGSGLVLALNGADPLKVTTYGTVTFSSTLASGSAYAVTVEAQPTTPVQTCTVTNGSGTITNAAISNVGVTCSPLIYTPSIKDAWTLMSLEPQDQPPGFTGPGERCCMATWTDASGRLWLFGGSIIVDPLGDSGPAGDLWNYDPTTGLWGEVAPLAAPAVVPDPRTGAGSWIDASGNLWLFGGSYYNDLWKYTIASNTWTAVAGSANTPGAAGVYGAQGTPAPGNTPGARSNVVTWSDAHGNLWLFGGTSNDLWEFSPTTSEWVWVDGSIASANLPKGVYGTLGVASSGNVPGGRSGAVGWTDSAGALWLFGGAGADSAGTNGFLNDLWKYTPAAAFGALGTWTWMGGSSLVNSVGASGTIGVPSTSSVPSARSTASAWLDSSGHFWLFGGLGCYDLTPGMPICGIDQGDTWEYNPSGGTWTLVQIERSDSPIPGVPNVANTPMERDSSGAWTDRNGNLWLYGGQFTGDGPAYFGDLWVITP
jgi:hypothetical protein